MTDQLPGAEATADDYPGLEDVFAAILEADDVPESGVMHLEAHTFANGEATYKVWVRGEVEPRGGYVESSR